MKKCMLAALAALLLALTAACGAAESAPPAEPETLHAETSGTAAAQQPAQELEPDTVPAVYDADELRLSMELGGAVVKLGDTAVAANGALIRADLGEDIACETLPVSVPGRIWFDGETVFYTLDSGIYACDVLTGERALLSEDSTFALRLDARKIYYVKQTDPESMRPKGELWCMDKDGGGAVLILPGEVAGNVAIRGGWVYYISAEDGKLYRSMLYGSEKNELASLPDSIELVTDRYLYYRESDGGHTLRRLELKSGAVVSLGTYGSVLRVGDKVYVTARQERNKVPDNQFSLSVIENGELRQLLMFENLGDDEVVYVWGEHVYLRRPTGEICRIRLSDPEQEKTDVLPAVTAFVDGVAYYLDGGAIRTMDCGQ